MKRLTMIAVVSVMILSAFVFASCGDQGSSEGTDLSDSKYVGTWKAVSMSALGESEAPEDDWILTVNADGTGDLASEEESGAFTWEPIEGGFQTTGDTKLKFKDQGDAIVAKIIGVELTFEKQ